MDEILRKFDSANGFVASGESAAPDPVISGDVLADIFKMEEADAGRVQASINRYLLGTSGYATRSSAASIRDSSATAE